ncbi:MAG TPA: ribonuclease HII [Cytophagales bacterium]|nr:ribonuclease HII [Cytophagales bacterium]
MALIHYSQDLVEVGVDEAGRGCLAGPVVAAAVVLPKRFKNDLLNDSKKLNEKQRVELREIILKEAISWAVGVVCETVIDEINILNSSFLAMHKALDALHHRPDIILVDGNRFKKYKELKHECIIKGDGKILSIAAASILAKTHRDDLMKDLHMEFPHYNWKQNKGYPTLAHRTAIQEQGPCRYHRKTFNLLDSQLDLFEECE